MKKLVKHTYSSANALVQLDDFEKMLSSNQTLNEQKQVLPFFKTRPDLSLLISHQLPILRFADCYAHEFDIYGDFVADLIVGDSKTNEYLLIEFENGKHDSIFKRKGKKATPDWAPRFESAHSQIMDWIWKLEDMRSSIDFTNTFGARRAKFNGLIITGKGMNLDPQEIDRLDWRTSSTTIGTSKILCLSFDDLLENFKLHISLYK
ncbi:Shedu anti-phage system protein SduA domain-containing protein [Klebsiella variicola]|uniref:DUF4263 domain-containing protein n=1 Tax=Klebsiella variicola TaxID=244366 RepID=A0A7H0EQ60_KLEVA|nr:Shedu anti-phage system protein SduA domain-containing protein [Klebsiella variicola]QNP25926.1 DUF4263 domain-containing protein [Klebsiella variicola]